MTVTYDDRLSRIFFHWRASLYEVVWKDMVVFGILYAILSCTYRFALNDEQRALFEDLVIQFNEKSENLMPTVAFLLAFFVGIIVQRWWTQFELLPWPEELMSTITFCMPEADSDLNLVRKTAARYFCLTTALAGRLLSTTLQKRFPTEEDIVRAGLMTVDELAAYRNTTGEVRFFVPMVWAQQMLGEEARNREVPPPHSILMQKQMCDCITRFRKLFCYDWVNIPLVYTQCVCFAVYVYMAACILGKQFIKHYDRSTVDYYVPILTISQLVFYVGWLKVGLRLMKPFGDDDEDFEIDSLLDRHIEVAFELADVPMRPRPKLQLVIPEGLKDTTALFGERLIQRREQAKEALFGYRYSISNDNLLTDQSITPNVIKRLVLD